MSEFMRQFPCNNPKCPNRWHRVPECPNLPISNTPTSGDMSVASLQVVPPSIPSKDVEAEAVEIALEDVLNSARTRDFHDSVIGLEVKHDRFSSRVRSDEDYDITVSGTYEPWYDSQYGYVYALIDNLSVQITTPGGGTDSKELEHVFVDEGDSRFSDLKNRMAKAVEEELEADPFHSQPRGRYFP